MRLVPLNKFIPSLVFQGRRGNSIMAQSVGNGNEKKIIKVDITSDSVCPWCYVGKKNLDKAIAASGDRFDFEIKWHPFFLDPAASKEGVNKMEYYNRKFESSNPQVIARMAEVFRTLGMEYNMDGLIGNTMDSHRLIHFAGFQGSEKQHKLVEEIFSGYFTQAKYVGDREFLLECAQKAGVEGAAEFFEDPNNGVKEVIEELNKYSAHISGVPYFVINGKQKLSGAQPPEVFLRAFEVVTK